MLRDSAGGGVMTSVTRVALGIVVGSLLSTCAAEVTNGGAANSASLIDPCSVAYPVQLFSGVAQRENGTPRLDAFRFDVPARVPICLRVANPAVAGHRVTSAEVLLDGQELLSEDDFKQTVGDYALSRVLDAGPHRLEVRVRSRPGTRLELTVVAPGPTLDNFTPVVADVGTSLTLRGSGFYGPLSVRVGDVELNGAVAVSPDLAVAITVPGLPIGPVTVSTPFGTATAEGVFTSTTPRGAVPFYPRADVSAPDLGSCVAPRRLRVLQDGDRVSIVVDFHRALPEDASVQIAIDDDARPATVEFTLAVRKQGGTTAASGTPELLGVIDGSSAVLSASFTDLKLHDIHRMGRLFVRVTASAACGSVTLPATASSLEPAGFHEVRSLFAPGLVLVKTAAPQAVATRNGIQVVATDPASEIVLMSIPPPRRLEDLLVRLAEDDDVAGAAPDPVLYRASHIGGGAGCGLLTLPPNLGPVFETVPGPLPAQGQWTLDQIGLMPHPSPLSGAGVVVAVLDTGVDSHPDVAANLLPGVDFTILGDGTTTDNDPGAGHGTGIASIIAAVQGNGGMVGVAPGASILPLRVVNFVGLGEAFSVFSALGALLGPASLRGGAPVPQVANISVNEDLNATAFIDAMLLPMPAPRFAEMIAIGVAMEARATAVVATGTALVASAGNGSGLQYPANVPGAFAIASVDNSRAPVTPAPVAGAGQAIALVAPTAEVSSSGLQVPGIKMAGKGTAPSYVCGMGSSFAAALVSGAVASVLARPPPALPVAFTGAAAARILITTATPLIDASGTPLPRNVVGAGELSLRATLQPPVRFPLAWSLIFESSRGPIDDFAFMPGVGDFALRGGGRFLDALGDPLGNDTVGLVAIFTEPKSWMVELGGNTNALAFGTPSGVEVRGPDGALVGTLAGAPLFRAAVSPEIGPAAPLVALSVNGGGVRIRRSDALVSGTDLATVQAPASGPIIAALWAALPAPPLPPLPGGVPAPPDAPSEPLVLAVRSAVAVDYYRVPVNVAACATVPTECPQLLGSSDVTGVSAISDWAFTAGASGPTSYFVNGSSNLFVAPMNLPVVRLLVGIGTGVSESYVALAANPRMETVYAVDADNARFAALRGPLVLWSDTRFGRAPSPQFGSTSLMRVSPLGTYGYIRSDATRLEGTAALDHAVFVGSLAQ